MQRKLDQSGVPIVCIAVHPGPVGTDGANPVPQKLALHRGFPRRRSGQAVAWVVEEGCHVVYLRSSGEGRGPRQGQIQGGVFNASGENQRPHEGGARRAARERTLGDYGEHRERYWGVDMASIISISIEWT